MSKHIIVLPNGTELSSGLPTGNAIQSVTLTQSVNAAQNLSLGSTCASCMEVNLFTPEGELSINAGEELILCKEDDTGTRQQIGVFITEKPTRPTSDTMKLLAFDRITKLDKDLSQWLYELNEWPYTLQDFAKQVCAACGLILVTESITNGDYEIQQFSAQGISGRKLMQWVGQIAGRFCRATPHGNVELAWYTPSEISITPDGEHFYYENALRIEDFQTHPIEKVQIRLTSDDVGAVWPDGEGEKNTYIITGNYLLTADSTATLQPIAQALYEQLKDVIYTPCTVAIAECAELQPGHTVQITDRNNKTITAYVMRKTSRGERDTFECTGTHRLDTTTIFNEQTYKALSGKVLEMNLKMEGLSIKASSLESQWNANEKEMETVKEAVAQLTVDANAIRTSVSDTQKATQDVADAQRQTDTRISTLEQTTRQVNLQLEAISEQGAERVVTSTGFTFDEKGMLVDKSDSTTKTQVTPDGMKVFNKNGGDSEVLSATSDGVDATNLHAKTYLIIGGRSRFENYGSNRTGCFWIGG